MRKQLIFTLLSFSLLASVAAQDCANPTLLCSGAPQTGDLTQNIPVSIGCFNFPYTSYFTFTTNTNNENPGNVTLSVFGIDCEGTLAADELNAIIVQVATGGDPCVPVSYVPVSPCGNGTTDFFVDSDVLEPSSTYLVIIGTTHDPAEGDCLFNAEISGQAVSIDACCDQQITLGQTATFVATGGNATPGYAWSPSVTLDTATGPEVISTPAETTEYTVTGSVGPCNNIQDLVTVIVSPPVGIPNTITPNGDGINDLWKISGISQFPNAQITIFDRWGQVIFKDIGYAQPWDGTNRGKTLPTATYYYVIELNSLVIEIPPITGPITLIH